MSYELNLEFLWNNDIAKIIAAEAAFALLGCVINGVWGGLAKGLLAFTFCSTMVISGSMILLNVVNLYEKLHKRFGNLLIQIEGCYIWIWGFFYFVSAIGGFIKWDLGNLVGYVELLLFIGHGILLCDSLTIPPETPQNSPEEAESQDESENEPNIDYPQSA